MFHILFAQHVSALIWVLFGYKIGEIMSRFFYRQGSAGIFMDMTCKMIIVDISSSSSCMDRRRS
jgi:hypothetical protein